jgi:hypothetical protein
MTNQELNLSEKAVGFLKETSYWSKILAIMGFVGIGLMLIFSFVFMFGLAGNSFSGPFSHFPASMAIGYGIVYIAMAVLYFFPVYYLYNFSIKTTQAIKDNDSNGIEQGLEQLKSHYKFVGILMIVMMVAYALAIVAAILFFATMSFM